MYTLHDHLPVSSIPLPNSVLNHIEEGAVVVDGFPHHRLPQPLPVKVDYRPVGSYYGCALALGGCARGRGRLLHHVVVEGVGILLHPPHIGRGLTDDHYRVI